MCDYSLHLVASRPANVGQPEVAVCLLPGTELAFDDDVQYERTFSLFGKVRISHKVARFRQVNMTDPHAHHDALEFPDGQIVKVTRLVAGQTATVLQLPASTLDHKTTPQQTARTIEV